LAYDALAEVMERARVQRLTRTQHILFRLGELIAYAECAEAFARRAAGAAQGQLSPKADTRFDAAALSAMSRVFAREAAIKVGEEGMRWLCGSAGVTDAEVGEFEQKMRLSEIHRAQAGLIVDMDHVADALYAR
jgi:alkylation response protein AidB-like acyl-CoA dehydrogenase